MNRISETRFQATDSIAPEVLCCQNIGYESSKTARPDGQRSSNMNGSYKVPLSDRLRKTSKVAANMDEELVAVSRADKRAFKAIFEHFSPRLKSFMLRQGAEMPLAEEIVQETMVKVWRKADQFNPSKASASTWIFTIARNVRIDLLRKINRPEPDMNDPAFVDEPQAHPADILSAEQQAARLRNVIAELPEDQQNVLRLAFFEDKAHPEVASELGIPLGTVKSRVRLAVKRIRKELGDIV